MFIYGDQYMLGVEAWLASPLFAVFGPSVAVLKLPVVLVNVATAVLLVWVLHRDGGLKPTTALICSLFYVWAVAGAGRVAGPDRRRQPRAVSLRAAAVGVARSSARVRRGLRRRVRASRVHRVRCGRDRRARRARQLARDSCTAPGRRARRHRLHGGVATGAHGFRVFQSVRARRGDQRRRSAAATTSKGWPAATAGRPKPSCRACKGMFGNYLGILFGADDHRLADVGVRSVIVRTNVPGLPAFWPLLGAIFAAALARVAWISVRDRRPSWRGARRRGRLSVAGRLASGRRLRGRAMRAARPHDPAIRAA